MLMLMLRVTSESNTRRSAATSLGHNFFIIFCNAFYCKTIALGQRLEGKGVQKNGEKCHNLIFINSREERNKMKLQNIFKEF